MRDPVAKPGGTLIRVRPLAALLSPLTDRAARLGGQSWPGPGAGVLRRQRRGPRQDSRSRCPSTGTYAHPDGSARDLNRVWPDTDQPPPPTESGSVPGELRRFRYRHPV